MYCPELGFLSFQSNCFKIGFDKNKKEAEFLQNPYTF